MQFKKNYPEMFKEYKQRCTDGKLAIGKLHLYKNSFRYWILNFPTKDHWRQNSRLEYLEKGLEEFKNKYQEWGITSLSFPRLGCQQGGLNWVKVKPLMEKYLSNLSGLEVVVYSYKPSEKEQIKASRNKRKAKPRIRDKDQRTLG